MGMVSDSFRRVGIKGAELAYMEQGSGPHSSRCTVPSAAPRCSAA
jgi:hypothetical protein